MKKIIMLSRQQIKELEAKAEGLIYLVYQLADIQEGLIFDAEKLLSDAGDYKFNIKFNVNKIKKISGDLRSEVWKRNQTEEDAVIKFGDESDKLRTHIEKYFYDEAKDKYLPFGEDWEREIMKLTKSQIIELYKHKCKLEQ